MKRLLGVFLVLIAVAVAVTIPVASANAVNTNNFRISNFVIDYELSKDSEGRSVLKTTETITAEFPDYDQNHGLERALPTSYDGHPVDLKLNTVEAQGASAKYSESDSGGVKLLRIGDASRYVHGTQTYRISYTQRDVTRFYKDTDRDEWYWDTNGTQWSVPIDSLSVSISLSPDIAQKLSAPPACYFGAQGATTPCDVAQMDEGRYSLQAANIVPGYNATLAFGFEKGTFSAYKMSLWQIVLMVWGIVQIASIPLVFIGIIFGIVLFNRILNRSREIQPIVAEYIPPRDTSVTTAAQVFGVTAGSTFTAQLIDLAVRRYIAIIETRPRSTWRTAEYDLVVTNDISSLLEEEKEIITDMFGHVPEVGERLALKKLSTDTAYQRRTLDNNAKASKLVESVYELRHKKPGAARPLYAWAIGMMLVGLLTVSIPLLIAGGIMATLGAFVRPLTDKGLALRRYLLGFDRYIKASEAERLKFLQGPDTAQKIGYTVSPDDPGEMVKLYERALPYAVLFGREKEWSKRLGEYYETTSANPSWYTGTDAFNAVTFATAMTSFSAASSYSGGANSSSGGSSGGGSSGGGGGGGGGGGW